MEMRALRFEPDGTVVPDHDDTREPGADGLIWVDAVAGAGDEEALAVLAAELDLDALAVRDAALDEDLSKFDDFGHHLLVVLHGLRGDSIETYEVHCFVTDRRLLTLHHEHSPAIDALWDHVLASPQLVGGGVDILLARVADVLTRRLLTVVDAFDMQIDALIDEALGADAGFLQEVVAVRRDLATVRRVLIPQRETLDVLRQSDSPLLTPTGRRRLSDVFDVAVRAAGELEAARSALSETLEAYRGAEARLATNVTKVLTIYAAIMLPLSLIAGFFGMNFADLPGIGSERSWLAVTVAMIALTVVSLGVFVALGWIGRPSGRAAGAALGRGLIEAARAPVQVGGTIYEVSTMPLRTISRRITRAGADPDEE